MSDQLPTATRVSDPGIRALYRLENRWQAWLDVEVALARAQAELGIIPADAAEAIARAARLELLDRARIDEGFARTGHTIVPLVWELSRVVGEPHGGWVHWGATTQNITQTLLEWHPTILHDLHEAQSYLYVSTGTGPYNNSLDPIQQSGSSSAAMGQSETAYKNSRTTWVSRKRSNLWGM